MKVPEPVNNHLEEVYDEVRTHLLGRNKFLDTVLPPVIFMLVNYFFGLNPALFSAVSVAVLITLFRLLKKDKPGFALGGLAAVFLTALLAWWMARAESFFLPSIALNSLLVAAMAISLIVRKPLIALGSYFSRRWPLDWYWHPHIRPAYMEVTLVWTMFMILRLVIQLFLYQNNYVYALGIFQIVTGTPATIVLLVFSYLYGVWRLKKLNGPSVREFEIGTAPPWNGQQRGF